LLQSIFGNIHNVGDPQPIRAYHDCEVPCEVCISAC